MKDSRKSISLNSDMGESFGLHSFGNDESLLTLIDTANVACGFHAGDPSGMRESVVKSLAAGVTIGAHPGLPDLVGFGRREMKLTVDEVRDIVQYQVGALKGFLDAEGAELDHIKPHGSLYGMVSRDEALMGAVCDVAELYGVPVFGMADTAHEKVAVDRGVPFVAEFYVDLEYNAQGGLIIVRRPQPTPVERAVERTVLALEEGLALAETGEPIPMRFESICVHSDTPGAGEVAAAIRQILDTHTMSPRKATYV